MGRGQGAGHAARGGWVGGGRRWAGRQGAAAARWAAARWAAAEIHSALADRPSLAAPAAAAAARPGPTFSEPVRRNVTNSASDCGEEKAASPRTLSSFSSNACASLPACGAAALRAGAVGRWGWGSPPREPQPLGWGVEGLGSQGSAARGGGGAYGGAGAGRASAEPGGATGGGTGAGRGRQVWEPRRGHGGGGGGGGGGQGAS
jgi:hypothetical protein